MKKALHQLYDEMTAHFAEHDLVFGDGPLFPVLMLIGEAPGREEVLAKRPFVGKAGKNLDEFLSGSGLNRNEIFISNVVKFRPTQTSKSTGKPVNRPPTPKERSAFSPWLIREINIVKPRTIATLGNSPLKALTSENDTIGEVHGRLLSQPGLPSIFPLYHPASVIYNRALTEIYASDMEKLKTLLMEEREN